MPTRGLTWTGALACLLGPASPCALLGAAPDGPGYTDASPSAKIDPPLGIGSFPNIIFIMTDDQRWDSLAGIAAEHIPQDVMPTVDKELIQKGVLFTEAFVTSPLCCPARASLMSGGFCAGNTGVLTTKIPNGGVSRFYDGRTLATLLQAKGYKTGLIGKYMNGYGYEKDGYDEHGKYIPVTNYVPPGWTVWLGTYNHTDYNGYYDLVVGASSDDFPAGGLNLPDDVRLPNDVSVLDEFLTGLEEDGFPHSILEMLRPLFTRAGDFDHDGDIDLDDFGELTPCLNGPAFSLGPECAVFDFDTDGDVDTADFLSFQLAFDPIYGGLPPLTEFYRDAALAFMEADQNPVQPFFLAVWPFHPHSPALPDEEHKDLFPGFEYRGRAWGEQDLSDKPRHVRDYAEPKFANRYEGPDEYGRFPDDFYADQLRCLRGIDGVVGAILAAIEQHDDLLDNTIVMFSSDNGYLWGEHKLFAKAKVYEESIRVPLVIRMPNMEAVGTSSAVVAMNLDVPATILELAGYTPQEIEDGPLSAGTSLLTIIKDLEDPNPDWRDHLLLQIWRPTRIGLEVAWAAIRNTRWKYVLYDYFDGDGLAEELYDLQSDPFELESLHDSPAHQEIKELLSALVDQELGLVITGMDHPKGYLPDGTNGVEYYYALGGMGGTPPYTWCLYTEDELPLEGLPEGLSLSSDGVISGIPVAKPGQYEFDVRVEDGSVSPHHGGPQWYVVRLQITIL